MDLKCVNQAHVNVVSDPATITTCARTGKYGTFVFSASFNRPSFASATINTQHSGADDRENIEYQLLHNSNKALFVDGVLVGEVTSLVFRTFAPKQI